MFGSVPRNAIYVLKIAAIGAFVFWTNSGFIDRVSLLLGHGRWVTLAGFVGMWAMTLLALLAAAFQSRLALRLGWAIIIAFSTAIGFAYRHASHEQRPGGRHAGPPPLSPAVAGDPRGCVNAASQQGHDWRESPPANTMSVLL